MENFYIASICLTDSIGSMRCRQLLEHFGSGRAVWSATKEELEESNLSTSIINELVNFRQVHPDCPEQLRNYCERKKIKLCSMKDPVYPELLKSMPDAPILLYYKGELIPNEARVGIVGTRKPTPYGLRVATNFAETLAMNGITVVSGAAVGIDAAAHKGAMKFGRTIAILGEGLEAVASNDKRQFLDRIIENGAVISEYSPNAHSNKKGMFPQRNRIIAGLSIGVVVVEGGESSGAMNTAQHAGNYGRLLFAVPGNIDSEKSAGCHELIRDGAILVRSAEDVLEDCKLNIDYTILPIVEKDNINFKSKNRTNIKPIKAKVIGLPPLEGDDDLVFQMIPSDNGISADEIMMKLEEIDSSKLSNILLELEMKGYIEVDDIGNYIRIYGKY